MGNWKLQSGPARPLEAEYIENDHLAQETANFAENDQMKLDRYDRAIVRALQLDGRITNSQLRRQRQPPNRLSEKGSSFEESGFIEGTRR